jgi:hypothetical protein
MISLYDVQLWNPKTWSYDTHRAFVSVIQAQTFVFVNLGYIVDDPENAIVYTQHPYNGCYRMVILRDHVYEERAVAFIDKVR